MTSILVTRGLKTSGIAADFYFRRNLNAGVANERHVSVNFGGLTRYVKPIDEDLAYIGASLFNYETFLKDEERQPAERITIAVRDYPRLASPTVEGILHDLVSFCLKVDTEVKMVQGIRPLPPPAKSDEKFGAVCLFSGGLDSLSGISLAKAQFGPTHGVFVQHDGLAGIVEKIATQYLKASELKVHEVVTQTGPKGLQQMRGFLYMLFGGILANMHHTNNIVVSEVGHTMFQPELTALDEVTLTTHPFLVRLTKELLTQAYGESYTFYEPFSDLTKSEAIALTVEKGAIPLTNSCRTTRWAYSSVSHCGQCYGCLVRRMSCIVAGVQDANYAADVLVKGVGEGIIGRRPGLTINIDDFTNLYGLLRFARDILDEKLDDTASLKIRTFAMQNLYKRFAGDMMAALYILYEEKNVGRNKWVRNFYEECRSEGIASPETAIRRITEVRAEKYLPDFGLKI